MMEKEAGQSTRIPTAPGRYLREFLALFCPFLVFCLISSGVIQLWRRTSPAPLPSAEVSELGGFEILIESAGAETQPVMEPTVPDSERGRVWGSRVVPPAELWKKSRPMDSGD